MRLFLVLLFFFTAIGSAFSQAATLPRADEPLPQILKEWGEMQKKVGDIRVAFQQTRTVPALKAPVVSQGQFWRFSDGSFRWEIGQPPAVVLVHDLQEFRVKESADADWKLLDEKDGRYRMWAQFLSGHDVGSNELSRNFSVQITGDTPKAVTVALMPKPLIVRRYLKQIDLQIEPSSKRLLQLRVIQGDGATVLMVFSDPKTVRADDKAKLLAR